MSQQHDYSFEERCQLLEKSHWRRHLSAGDIHILAGRMHYYELSRGSKILHEGDYNTAMLILLEGKVNIMKKASDGSEYRLASIDKDKTIGEMSLIDGQPCSASVVAATDVEIMMLTKESFGVILQEVPSLGVKILLKISTMLSKRLRHTSGQLTQFLSDDQIQSSTGEQESPEE